jgi:prolyl-tRNA synthetase
MRQSHLFTKTVKLDPKDEPSTNAKLLTRAGFVRKEMAGVYTILPLGMRVLKKIEHIIREEMQAIDGQEVLMPTLQAKSSWKKTGRLDTYDVLFSLKNYVFGPTHEEVVTPLLREFISSYKDLPVAVFQIQNKFRDEKRAKSGVLRGREFMMKDLYSFHTDNTECEKYYDRARKAYHKIFTRAGLNAMYTFASGGAFSKYSHEFQVITEAGEDVIHVCETCNVAINQEIIKEQNACPECGSKKLKQEKAIEVGNIFKLKTRFTEAFDCTYTNSRGKPQYVVMGCYGIGLQRLMGAIVEVHHDDKGIIWPSSLAPFACHLIALSGAEQEADKLYEKLQKQGIEVLYDDRDSTAGQKFADADLIGIPQRLVISPKTLAKKSVEVKPRGSAKVVLRPLNQVIQVVQ